ncbi:hypothetical protein DFH09DRAFT_1073267 [Mycena vulgaris]|nr:hypothetical protein DFH09DRAFT_1073267 [Mycena vulgaris]
MYRIKCCGNIQNIFIPVSEAATNYRGVFLTLWLCYLYVLSASRRGEDNPQLEVTSSTTTAPEIVILETAAGKEPASIGQIADLEKNEKIRAFATRHQMVAKFVHGVFELFQFTGHAQEKILLGEDSEDLLR